MPSYAWDGLGVAEGTVLDASNANAVGNGDPISHVTATGTVTRIFDRDALGNGLSVTGAAGALARLDTPVFTGGGELAALRVLYKPSGAPTGAIDPIVIGRNPTTFSGYVSHLTTNIIEFRNATNAVVSGGQTPALVNNDLYQIDVAFLRNTLTTPSTTNGRIIGRVRSLSAPGTWNAGAEFYIDTGYTVNVTIDKTQQFRCMKNDTVCAHPQFFWWNWAWRYSDTPNTSTVKASAITNFVGTLGPTISTTGTGPHYLIYAVGTAGSGGALTYSITQTDGNPFTPVVIAPGVWRVTQDTAGPRGYTVTVDEAGAGPTDSVFVVPQASAGVSGQFRRQVQIAGVLV